MANDTLPPNSRRRRAWMTVLTAAGALGLAAIVLPFAWDESPWTVVSDADEIIGAYKLLAWPFFLSLPITVASVRWLFAGKLSAAERAIAYAVSAVAVLLTVAVYFTADVRVEDLQDWVSYTLPLLSLGLGMAALAGAARSADSGTRSYAPVLAMQAAYLPSCLLCLCSFIQDLQPGGYCSLAVAIAFIVQAIVVLRARDGMAWIR
jgi:hypothetical protein